MHMFPPLRPKFSAALRDVSSKNAKARALAAEALAFPIEGREQEAMEANRPLLDDKDPTVRGAALVTAGKLKDVGGLAQVLARFEDEDAAVRQIAMIAAADIGDSRATLAIKRALKDERPELRFQAVASLAALAGEDAIDDLVPLASDADAEVRAHLADALGSLESKRAKRALKTLLEDTAIPVRQAAAIALARIGDASGARTLAGALADPERVFEAAWALGEIRATEAAEPLAAIASSVLKPLATKAAAAAALVRIGDPRGVPALRSVLRAFRSDARSYAAELVGELALVELADDVIALVDRPKGADPAVVARAIVKLAKVSDLAKGALERMASGEGETARIARDALGR
jgi:HEAT repeat protein